MILVFCLFISLVHTQTQVHAEKNSKDNMLKNGSFEDAESNNEWTNDNGPTDWSLWIPSGSPELSIDEETYDDGDQSIRIQADETSRADISQDVSVEPGTTYELSYSVKTDDVEASWGGIRVRIQYFDAVGDSVKDNDATEDITGTNDWSEESMNLSIPNDVDSIKVELFFETATGKAWFDDITLTELDSKAVTDFKLEEDTLVLNKEDTKALTPVFTPESPDNKGIEWSSSDEEVATVDDEGVITGEDYGAATITANTEDGDFTAESLVSVEPSDSKGYKELRNKWLDKLIGNDRGASNDSDVTNKIGDIVTDVKNSDDTGYWDTMDTGNDRDYLWEDLKDTSISANVTSAYDRLEEMAKVYTLEESSLYQDEQLKEDIINGLDWMYTHRYNEDKDEYDNWYDWEIGVPKTLGNTLILMNEELSDDSIQDYLSVIHYFVPDPTERKVSGVTETGANRLDKALIVTLEGVIDEDSKRILEGRDALSQVFLYVDEGDGMYKDGSFIQHEDIAYTGGYGGVLLSDMANMFYLLKDSPWDITNPNAENVYEWIENAFEPLIYKGAMMDMVNGRGMTREGESDRTKGRAIVRSLLELAQGASEEDAEKINQMVKYWIQEDTDFDKDLKDLSIYDIKLMKTLMNDDSIEPRDTYNKNHVFSAMDRVVHHDDDIAYGISMFSKDISALEYGNGENKKGWYAGVGMTSLYTDDLDQFADEFWPTVDAVRLPGTTTDHTTSELADWESYLNTEDWVGGATIDGLYGTAGMDFSLENVTDSPLAGKKSWFMFDDEIVALGSDISNSNGDKTETIVENRKLNEDGDNTLIVNGEEQLGDLEWSDTLNDVHWAHLEGDTDNSDIGYYFPEKGNLEGLREERKGSWEDINDGGSSDSITRNYLSLAFNHGEDPDNASYEYVLLPNKNTDETKAYQKNPDIEVMNNNKNVAAVKEKSLGITAANFFHSSSADSITASDSESVMMKEQGDVLQLAVSDPTRKQDKVMIELDRDNVSVENKDNTVEVIGTSPTIQIEVDVSDATGETHAVTFEKKSVNISDMEPMINDYIQKEELDATFADDLIARIDQIDTIMDQGEKQQAKAYIEDLLTHFNDSFVQEQGLISEDATESLNRAIEKLE